MVHLPSSPLGDDGDEEHVTLLGRYYLPCHICPISHNFFLTPISLAEGNWKEMEGDQKWSTNNNAHKPFSAWLPVGVHTFPSTHQHFRFTDSFQRGT
jgi:hypothetical protein